MKKVVSYAIAALIAIGLIFIIQPYIDNYKNKKKYAFTVQSKDGDLTNDSFKGKVLAIYFGYTYCPDVCPTSLSALAQALQSFDETKLKDFKGLFISVDPDRDTFKNLEEYAKYFHPTFLGATSNKKNIDDITNRFGSHYKKVFLENSQMDYSVSHTSFIYIFDKEGNYVDKIDHFSSPEAIRNVLQRVL